MEENSASRFSWVFRVTAGLAACITVLGLYVVAYCACVGSLELHEHTGVLPRDRYIALKVERHLPLYPFESKFLETFFAPIHGIDRRLRPEEWPDDRHYMQEQTWQREWDEANEYTLPPR